MGRLEDIAKRNKRANRGGSSLGGIGGLISSELNDPTADSADLKNRILAMVIVVGVIVGIVVLALVLK